MARTMSIPSVCMVSEVMPVWGRARATMTAAKARNRRIQGPGRPRGPPSRCLGPLQPPSTGGSPNAGPPIGGGPRTPGEEGKEDRGSGGLEPEHQIFASRAFAGPCGSFFRALSDAAIGRWPGAAVRIGMVSFTRLSPRSGRSEASVSGRCLRTSPCRSSGGTSETVRECRRRARVSSPDDIRRGHLQCGDAEPALDVGPEDFRYLDVVFLDLPSVQKGGFLQASKASRATS